MFFNFILKNDNFTFLINLMGFCEKVKYQGLWPIGKIGLASAIGLFDGPPEPLGESQNRKVANSEKKFGIN